MHCANVASPHKRSSWILQPENVLKPMSEIQAKLRLVVSCRRWLQWRWIWNAIWCIFTDTVRSLWCGSSNYYPWRRRVGSLYFIYGSAIGKMVPSLDKVESASQDTNELICTRLIQNLHSSTFTVTRGWTVKFWERQLQLKAKQQIQQPTEVLCLQPPRTELWQHDHHMLK